MVLSKMSLQVFVFKGKKYSLPYSTKRGGQYLYVLLLQLVATPATTLPESLLEHNLSTHHDVSLFYSSHSWGRVLSGEVIFRGRGYGLQTATMDFTSWEKKNKNTTPENSAQIKQVMSKQRTEDIP